MEEQKHVRFAELLTLHVSNVIKKRFVNEQLNTGTLTAIRDTVRLTISEVFRRSSHTLTQESINWLANQYFKSIQLGHGGGVETVSDMVVINEYKLADLPYHDIQLMRNLFNETTLGPELDAEYRRRSTS